MTDERVNEPSDHDEGDGPVARPFPESLCHRCVHQRLVSTKTSQFIMCSALASKYPRQPVLSCTAFTLRR